ncbi:hypothetical protein L1987_60876 [Smallanthus sonchifolius]|uniref:Uncharacterized protein n=1 Tax=Smallanthus sonchifolius TaxID=185202 RepID=A0ACB9DA61_9ASTR|nr:hypothetical protein L1987_60876 [Smallanthus sonchifolius]
MRGNAKVRIGVAPTQLRRLTRISLLIRFSVLIYQSSSSLLQKILEVSMGGRSYSPSPPRGGRYGRRGRSPSPRGRYGGGGSRGRDLPTSLLVRNLRLDCRPEDLRRPFGEFGPLKDIYLPRDYYSGL